MNTSLNQIGQIAIPVRDIDEAIHFYRETLGMRFLFKAPPGLGFFDCGAVRLMLDEPAKDNAGNGSVLYFKVDDLDESYQNLSAKGVLFEQKPHLIAKMPDHELWMAFFRDVDGNLLALMAEKKF